MYRRILLFIVSTILLLCGGCSESDKVFKGVPQKHRALIEEVAEGIKPTDINPFIGAFMSIEEGESRIVAVKKRSKSAANIGEYIFIVDVSDCIKGDSNAELYVPARIIIIDEDRYEVYHYNKLCRTLADALEYLDY